MNFGVAHDNRDKNKQAEEINKSEEELVIPLSHSCAQPRTVVVYPLNARITFCTVGRPRRPVNLSSVTVLQLHTMSHRIRVVVEERDGLLFHSHLTSVRPNRADEVAPGQVARVH